MPKERFGAIPLEHMTPEQREMANKILQTRGSLRGFEATLRSPDLGDRLQRVGEYIRYKTSIPSHLNEMAILMVARQWDSQFEWHEHAHVALAAGLAPAILDALAEGQRPNRMSDDETLIFDFCSEVLRTKHASDANFARLVERFGEGGAVDLLGTIGYYSALAIVVNVSRYQLPAGTPLPLKVPQTATGALAINGLRLFWHPTSPFVRKVMVVAHELGVADQIEIVPGDPTFLRADEAILPYNPLSQVPTLALLDGGGLADSRVICEYLDGLAKGEIFPGHELRWVALRLQNTGDGLMDAALLCRMEAGSRPSERQWQPWVDGQRAKIVSCLNSIEAEASGFADRVDIGTITIACALSYLDLRFSDLPWREGRPNAAAWYGAFSARPSMVATEMRDGAPAPHHPTIDGPAIADHS